MGEALGLDLEVLGSNLFTRKNFFILNWVYFFSQ